MYISLVELAIPGTLFGRIRIILHDMSTRRNPRQVYPFFKAHVFDTARMAWVDARRETFGSAEAARAFLSEYFAHRQSRIIIVTEKGRQVHEPNEK